MRRGGTGVGAGIGVGSGAGVDNTVLHEGHAVVPAGNWVPQFLQNMGFLSLAVEMVGVMQPTGYDRRCPHSPQNMDPGFAGVPHDGQVVCCGPIWVMADESAGAAVCGAMSFVAVDESNVGAAVAESGSAEGCCVTGF